MTLNQKKGKSVEINSFLNQIKYPFVFSSNERKSEVQKQTNEWIKKFNLVKGEEGFQRYISYSLADAAAFCHPKANLFLLRCLSDILSWLIISDDYYDELEIGKNSDYLKEVFGQFEEILNGKLISGSQNDLHLSLYDVSQRIKKFGDGYYDYFKKTMIEYWSGCIIEAKNRHQNYIPNIDEYMKMRINTIGMREVFMFIGPDLNLDHKILDDPFVDYMTIIACKISAFLNDLISYAKESNHGDPNNIITCLMHENKLSFNEAAQRVVELHNNALEEFIEKKEELIKRNCNEINDETKFQILSFVSGLESWIVGISEWERNSSRYRNTNNADIVLTGALH